MAKMGDAGITAGGNWWKPAVLAESGKPFWITGAELKPGGMRNGVNYPDQVDFTVRLIGLPEPETDEESAERLVRFSLSNNSVRQKFIDWFEAHPDEPITGVNEENGLVLYEGTNISKGNPPYLFRDATEEELQAAADDYE